jgi:p-aminobenzoyl-glutamate transporter AbgT
MLDLQQLSWTHCFVVITTIAIEAGHMKASTAAGLVSAAMLSALIFSAHGRSPLACSPKRRG